MGKRDLLWWCCCVAVALAGCRTRLLSFHDELDGDGGLVFDLSAPPDAQPDLTVRDLVLPVICRNVYAVDTSGMLSSFDTAALRFDNIGNLPCRPSDATATPFSMSISRDTFAYVLYSSGEIFRVDTTTAACQKTPFIPGQPDFQTFGMGFVADAPGGLTESLYIASPTNLAVVQMPSFAIKPIGGIMGNPELTGTAAAELWGFFPGATSMIGRIDKQSAFIDTVIPLPSLTGQPQSWAFAFWGGSFWIFLRRQGDTSTGVYRVDRATGLESTVIRQTGRDIVGAGVSSCAPLGMDR